MRRYFYVRSTKCTNRQAQQQSMPGRLRCIYNPISCASTPVPKSLVGGVMGHCWSLPWRRHKRLIEETDSSTVRNGTTARYCRHCGRSCTCCSAAMTWENKAFVMEDDVELVTAFSTTKLVDWDPVCCVSACHIFFQH